jgi:hypothetical protein
MRVAAESLGSDAQRDAGVRQLIDATRHLDLL